jgi:hypothetical protein
MFDMLYCINAAFYTCQAHKAQLSGESARPYACLAGVYATAATEPLWLPLLLKTLGG